MAIVNTQSEANSFVQVSPLLASVRDISSGMTADQRLLVVRQLATLLEDYYVHLPLKRSSLGIDPVQEASLLVDEVRFIQSDGDFFRRIFGILKRLRDRHTALRLPSPWRDMVAYLPFAAESYYEAGRRRLVVSKLMADVGEPSFSVGVEITHWNGMSVGRFIEALSWESEGANPFARIATTMRSLTVRPLGYMLPPTEDWVTLTYLTPDGIYHSATIPWRVYMPPGNSSAASANVTSSGGMAMFQGVDRNTLIINNTWYDLFSRRGGAGQSSTITDSVRFQTVKNDAGEFGYIRIFSFDVPDPAAFVADFARVLGQLPQRGLIIDIRSNPGGTIPAGEGLFALFTKGKTTPQPVSFRNTPAVRPLGDLPMFLKWKRSLDMQLETGEIFTQGFALTDSGDPALNGIYPGKVVLIIDALCYSTTDFFVAGMQDNGLAYVIGVDPVTGAGGANVWSQRLLRQFVAESGGTEVTELPSNIDIEIAMRRSMRVGPNDGLPLEGLGVFADRIYQPTRRDVLGENEDLIDLACRVLSGQA